MWAMSLATFASKIEHEAYLAFRDVVIEELEANVEENNKKIVAQQEKIKELKVLIDKLIRF
jgi:uncharacterized coiled-coil protein SlyX